MRESTTARVSTSTRDALRELAADDGLTMDEHTWLNLGASSVAQVHSLLAALLDTA